jgi:hypothetical protein
MSIAELPFFPLTAAHAVREESDTRVEPRSPAWKTRGRAHERAARGSGLVALAMVIAKGLLFS